MAKGLNSGLWIVLFALSLLLSGCAARQVDLQQLPPPPEAREEPPAKPADVPPRKAKARAAGKLSPTVKRVVAEKELRSLEHKDPQLNYQRCLEILSRLNGKDKEYIRYDIKRKRPMRVPRDFSTHKNWTPLPRTLTGTEHIPKFVLVIKDISFLGWYERGLLVGDTYVGIGKMKTWTKRGMYRIKEKDPDHISTYPNAYGEPSLMPMALRIYDRVWIHAGDVIGPKCSHGCINVPIFTADKLYAWAEIGTVVLITESLKDLGKDMRTSLPKPKQAENVKPGPVKPAPRESLWKTSI